MSTPTEGPHVIHCTHPDIAAIDEAVMLSDRRWFAAHPTRLVRLRPTVEGEFLVDTAAGLYGQRPIIGTVSDPGNPPHVAVVSICHLVGLSRQADGTGGRMRFPVGHYPRSRRKQIEAQALALAKASIAALRRQRTTQAVITFPQEGQP